MSSDLSTTPSSEQCVENSQPNTTEHPNHLAEWRSFLLAVYQMRIAQKVYFHSRSPRALVAAKTAEKACDAWLDEADQLLHFKLGLNPDEINGITQPDT